MYLPGEGIGYHRDDPLLGDPVSIFGSQSDTTMIFKNPSNRDSFRIRLFARSLLVLTGAARHEWHHGIPRPSVTNPVARAGALSQNEIKRRVKHDEKFF